MFPVRRALLSVTDKTGLAEFGKGLREFDVHIALDRRHGQSAS